MRWIGSVLTLTLLSATFGTHPLEAQRAWSLELQGGAGFPVGDLEEPLVTGPGVGAVVAYRFMPHLAVYGGWDWFRFGSGTSFAGNEVDFEETGYVVGLRFEHPLPFDVGIPLAYRIHGGATYKHLELEDTDGTIIADSGHGFGWEVGGGLTWDVTPRWYLSPGVRYRALNRDVEIDEVTNELNLAYVALHLGVGFRF